MDLISFLKELSVVIAIISSIIGIMIVISRQIILKKESEIKILNERMKTLELFSDENLVKKFESFKESIALLEKDRERALEEHKKEIAAQLEDEIKKRNELEEEYNKLANKKFNFENFDICGHYSVIGRTPSSLELNYFGKLIINKNGETYSVNWIFKKGKQNFKGTGILYNNYFSVAYIGHYNGIVIYEIITPEILRGVWAGLDEKTIGFEECRRITFDPIYDAPLV
jgi:hypothetical protein